MEKENLLEKFKIEKGYRESNEIIAGVDPSLQKTGIIIINCKAEVLEEALIIPHKNIKGIPRLKFIKEQLMKILKKHKVTIVAIESYSFGPRGLRRWVDDYFLIAGAASGSLHLMHRSGGCH